MNKQRCKKFVSIFLVATMLCSISIVNSLAFTSPTHEYTTKNGLRIVKETMKEPCLQFYTGEIESDLYEYCVRPDFDENNGIFKWHFYNPATEKNFMGETTSALTKFRDHYDEAVKAYKVGQEKKSWEELGRSLHFLEDINTPVHTNSQKLSDAISQLLFHTNFEKLCTEVQEDYCAEMTRGQMMYYLYNSTTQIAKSSANLANDNYYAMMHKTATQTEIAGNSIINAQKSVAGVLYKFYQDINS